MEAVIAWFVENSTQYGAAVVQHLRVSALAVAAALTAALPLGVASAGNPAVSRVITGVFSTLRIIPSLALLLLCVPIMGVGIKPAITALVFLAAPPLLINTTLAFSTLPEAVIETARGIGMGRQRIFWTVKAPLALPLILTGLKTAAVEVIASATLAAYIGGGGLGAIIFTGLGLMKMELLLIGGISVAVLSLAADFLLTNFEKKITIVLFGGFR
ncbi:MAG: ABC transporter permease [Spirochaetaceae bacterium]|jgi:osmoprotectant transport system permease protein|nr:ABC transporter permease [Spirochaetaceae bacterium]